MLITAVQVTESMLHLDNEHCKKIGTLSFDVQQGVDNLNEILAEAEIEKPLIFAIEDEIYLYACFHLAASYCFSPGFMEWFYNELEIPKENRLNEADRDEGAKTMYNNFTSMLLIIDQKLAHPKKFIACKEELNIKFPIENLKS